MIGNPSPSVRDRAKSALDRLTQELLVELDNRDHWSGELSSSALSTAVATIALGEMDRQLGSTTDGSLVQRGLAMARGQHECGWRLGRYHSQQKQYFHDGACAGRRLALRARMIDTGPWCDRRSVG